MIIKGEEGIREHRKIGNVNHLYIGKESIIRVTELCIGKKLTDCPIQLLCVLELHCEVTTTTNVDEKKCELNSSSTEFCTKRTAAEIAK